MRHEPPISKPVLPVEADDSAKTLPLMGGVIGLEPTEPGTDTDGTGVSARFNFLNQGTLLLLLVATIASGSIYLMRVTHGKIDRGDINRDAAAKIEQALAKLASPQAMDPSDPLRPVNMQTLFQNTDAVVSMFTHDQTQRQVPLEYLKKNPFVMVEDRPVMVQVSAGQSAPSTDQSIQDQARKIDTEFRTFRLEMVVEGRNPIAMISGKTVRVGDQLGRFSVKAINGRSVDLQGPNGTVQTLMMQDREEDLVKLPTRRR